MLKIKVSNNFPELQIQRQTPQALGIWEDCHFFVNDDDLQVCDYWVVYEGLSRIEEAFCPPENLIFIAYEPPSIKTYNPSFLNQFKTILACHYNIRHPNVIYDHQAQPWFINQTYDELIDSSNIKKTKLLSLISSEKRTTQAHCQRHLLCLKLKEYFGEDVDLYGRGINEFDDKWEVIAPYRYSLAVENSVYKNYFTEKVVDCFLGETVPLYYGCPNLEDFLPQLPYIPIDIFNIDQTIKTIENIIFDESIYESYREGLVQTKKYYLDHLNLFPKLTALIHELQSQTRPDISTKRIRLYPETHPKFLGDRLIRKFNKVCLGKRYDY